MILGYELVLKGGPMKIAAYCRVSTDKEEQLDSLEHQKNFFLEYAQKNGHRLVRLYADEGISGTSLKKRAEFQRLMNDAQLGLFEMVVVKDISRFARNTVDFLQSIRALKSLGINTLFLTANMESLGGSEFILTVFGAIAQEESVNLSKRVKFGKRINAEKGRVPQRVYGYDRIDNFTLAINEKEATVVREIYRLYLEVGLGCRTISIELNRLGYLTKLGCEWNPRGVRRVLTNSIYCGEYVNRKYEIRDCLEGKLVPLPPEEHLHHARPEWAIVTPEVFERTQRLLDERRAQYDSGEIFRAGRYSDRHIFSTLIKCAHCGRSFCRKQYTRKNTRVYWKCPTNDQYTSERCDNRITITESELLQEIRSYLSRIIQDKNAFVEGVLSEIRKREELPTRAYSPEMLQKQKKRLLMKKEKYQEMYVSEIITIHELKEKIMEINREFDTLEKNIEKNITVEKNQKTTALAVEHYVADVEAFLSLETVTNADMQKIITHITVAKDGEVKIHLRNRKDAVTA